MIHPIILSLYIGYFIKINIAAANHRKLYTKTCSLNFSERERSFQIGSWLEEIKPYFSLKDFDFPNLLIIVPRNVIGKATCKFSSFNA